MGLLNTLFGGKKAVEDAGDIAKTITHGVMDAGDALFYTKEEEARDELSKIQFAQKMILSLQDQFTPRAISRRILMFGITINFTIAFWTCIVLGVMGEIAKLKSIVDVVISFRIGYLMLLAAFFYFGYYGWQKVKEAK